MRGRYTGVDILGCIRYARARVYSLAVRVHYEMFFARHLGADLTGSGRASALAFMQAKKLRPKGYVHPTPPSLEPAPLCTTECEVVDGDADCTCLTVEQVRERIESRLTNVPMVVPPPPAGLGVDEKHGLVPAPFTGTPYRPDPED